MTNEQTGMFIKILCLQHQNGHLSKNDMINICKTYDERIFSKFKKDDDGLYYNEALETEIIRRKTYSLSRSNNRKRTNNQKVNPKKNICKTYVEHMETETITETITENKKEQKQKIEKKEVAPFVFLTDQQMVESRLKFNEGYLWAIETLSNYKQSSGKKYKSDYHALVGWVYDKYQKEKLILQKNGKSTTQDNIQQLANILKQRRDQNQ